jgi:hypothetical protein
LGLWDSQRCDPIRFTPFSHLASEKPLHDGMPGMMILGSPYTATCIKRFSRGTKTS